MVNLLLLSDLAIKCLKQSTKTLVSLENLCFNINPRSRHSKRIMWIKQSFLNFQFTLICCEVLIVQLFVRISESI